MALKTTTQLIEDIEAMIDDVRTAQSVGTGGKHVQRADLATLLCERRNLYGQLRRENGSNPRAVNVDFSKC